MTDQEQQLMKRLRDLCQYIREGKIIEAMHEFYDENVEMQENLELPCVGLEANIKREEEWLTSVKEFKGYEVQALGVGGNTTFQECTFNYITVDGKEVFTAGSAGYLEGQQDHSRAFLLASVRIPAVLGAVVRT